MHKIKALATVRIGRGGLVQLTDEQAMPRRHALEPTDTKGVYQVMEPVELKSGEIFGMPEIDKRVSGLVEEEKPRRGRPPKDSDE